MKTQIFKNAWKYAKELGITFAYALKRAWREFKLNAMLNKGIALFTFMKKDGTIREAAGTRSLEIIPAEFHPKGTGKASDKVICFFDMEAFAWKCFSKDSLLIKNW